MNNNNSFSQTQSVNIGLSPRQCNQLCNSYPCEPSVPYTLEQHLFSFSGDKAYQYLWSSWITEKEQYRRQLETVPATFATYSSHTVDHSETILTRIEALLGEERIRLLSPTDTWLLLQCAYTHDFGMCVSDTEKEQVFEHSFENIENFKKLLDDDDFRKFLDSIQHDYLKSAPNTDNVLFASVRFLLQARDNNDEKTLQRLANQLKNIGYSRAKSMVATVTTSYFRKRHAERTRELLLKNAQADMKKGIFPRRLREIVAEIDYCHGGSWDDVMKLPNTETGFSSDLIHPQFAAALLRLGDLLDLDSNRFNEYQVEQLISMPKVSIVHELKHMSISDLLVTPKEIRITARYRFEDMQQILEEHYFKDKNNLSREEKDDETKELIDRSAKSLRAWISMIEDDLHHFSNDWNAIIPDNMTGSLASLKKCDIYVLDQSKPVEEDNIELRYSISSARSSQLMQGAGLYSSVWAFVREIVQNASDASKKQLARNALHFFPREDKDFPHYAPYYRNLKQIEEFEPVRVIINFLSGQPSKLQFVIIDSGIGITYEKLKQMRHIGAIAKSKEEQNEIDEMPIWLRPTGEFGIGMQSVFSLADSMKIDTYPVDEHHKPADLKRHIKLYCPELGGDIVNREETKEPFEKDYHGTDIRFEFELCGDIVLKLFFDKSLINQNPNYYQDEASYAYIFGKDKTSLLDSDVIFSSLRQFIHSTFTDDLIGVNFYLMQDVKPEKDWRSFIRNFDLNGEIGKENSGKSIECIKFRFPEFHTVSHISDNQHNYLWQSEQGEDKTVRFWYNREEKELSDSASVLLTLKNTGGRDAGFVRVFYRGIAICSDAGTSAVFQKFAIPGVDLTVNIMSGNVSRYLEINREYIKASGYPELFGLIRESILGFYRTVAAEEEKTGKPFYEAFWEANPQHRLTYLFAANLFDFKTIKYPSDDISVASLLAITKSSITQENVPISQILKTSQWFTTIKALNPSDSLAKNEITQSAVTDIVSDLFDLKYRELKVVRSAEWSDRCELIYTLTSDSNLPLEMQEDEYGILCITEITKYINTYFSAEEPEKESIGRLILSIPAIEQFKCLAVDKIPAESPGVYLSHFSRFIILPFKLKELISLVGEINNVEFTSNADRGTFYPMPVGDEKRALFPDDFLKNFVSKNKSSLNEASKKLRKMIDDRIMPRLENPKDKPGIYRAYAELFKLFHY